MPRGGCVGVLACLALLCQQEAPSPVTWASPSLPPPQARVPQLGTPGPSPGAAAPARVPGPCLGLRPPAAHARTGLWGVRHPSPRQGTIPGLRPPQPTPGTIPRAAAPPPAAHARDYPRGCSPRSQARPHRAEYVRQYPERGSQEGRSVGGGSGGLVVRSPHHGVLLFRLVELGMWPPPDPRRAQDWLLPSPNS